MKTSRKLNADRGLNSELALSKGLNDEDQLLSYLRQLPYGRNRDRGQLDLVLREGQGTCSSKHALFSVIAEEQRWADVELVLCMYKMTRANTPGIGQELEDSILDYLPEAHCYLKVAGQSIDITHVESDLGRIRNVILEEQIISPKQVGQWKIDFHKNYISNWRKQHSLALNFEDIWRLREICIRNLKTSSFLS